MVYLIDGCRCKHNSGYWPGRSGRLSRVCSIFNYGNGNLTYHFKTKALLMQNIYQLMHEEAVDFILPKGYLTLYHFEEMMMNYITFNQKYSFFFNDVVFITTQFPKVGKMYEASNLQRFKEGRKLIDYYVESNRMFPETEQIDYDKLVHSIWMITAFWTAQSRVISHHSYQINKVLPLQFLWQLLFPFLTKKGWDEYRDLQKFAKRNINKTK